MQPDSKIINKIRKLLALARDGGATEAEAALAMQLAQEKMAEYNLSSATFEASGGAKEDRAKEFSRLPLLYQWKRDLLRALGEVNFCRVEIRRDLKSYEVIGRKSNIAAMHHMFEYLVQTIERLVVAEVGKSPQARYSKWSHSFRLGCTIRLVERLKDRHRRQLEEQEQKAREEQRRSEHPAYAGTKNALVVLREYAQQETDLNYDMMMGWEPGTTARRREENLRKWEERQALLNEKRKSLQADGVPERVAYYMSLGFSREKAEEIVADEEREETPAQRRRRMEKERRDWERWEERDRRRAEARARQINQEAYNLGKDRADEIGLDEQVSNDPTRALR